MMEEKKTEAILDLVELEPATIKPENIYLDPNNPRFAKGPRDPVPQSRIKEEKIQTNVLTKMIDEIGIGDILASVERYGFLSIDRVIVRPIDEVDFVVVEGNRRIASLRIVKEQDQTGELTLDNKIRGTLNKIDVLIYGGDKEDIAWTIQGLRHLTGVKGWPRPQQAEFITENFYEEKNMAFREIGRLLNMGSTEVGRLVRSHYAFMQAIADDEYGDTVKREKFSMFQEAVFRKPSLKEWLGWDDKAMCFQNMHNFGKYLSWIITEKEEGAIIERAIDARDILSQLVLKENRAIFDRFDNGEIDIFKAKSELDIRKSEEDTDKEAVDVKHALDDVDRLYRKLSTLPIHQIISDTAAKDRLSELFKEMKAVMETYEGMLSAKG